MSIIQSFANLPLPWWLCICTILGANVGSFLNVVIYRLPLDKSLIHPGSRCPSCEHALAWYDNVPVLGWLWLRGKCRYCKAPISAQYPIVEAAVALLFAGLFAVYYMMVMRPGFSQPGFNATWPVLVVHLALLAGLFASTVIDAKLFIIPRQIPWTLTLIALIVLPGSVWLGWTQYVYQSGLVPIATDLGIYTALGGVAGLAVAFGLLRLKVLPLSFADFEQQYEAAERERKAQGKDEPSDWFHYPHPRREVLKELMYVAWPTAGMVIAAAAGANGQGGLPGWVYVLGGAAFGYLFGAGIIWFTRILGTLGFGKEAMGLGDVHLLAAIGAVLGPGEAIVIYFLAPFFGLTAAILMFGLGSLLKKRFQPIPFGPYLAGAAVVLMVWREPIMDFCRPLLAIFDIFFLS